MLGAAGDPLTSLGRGAAEIATTALAISSLNLFQVQNSLLNDIGGNP
jgi:hypothetical protein